MALRFLAAVSAMAILAAPSLALAQKGGAESRPAVMDFGLGALGSVGSAAIGAGLRLSPAGPGAVALPPPPAPITPAPAPAAMPATKPAPATGAAAAARPAPAAGKPAPLPAAGRPTRATGFIVDPAVSARVRQQVLAATLPTSSDPEALRQAVAAGIPWTEFDRQLREHGYDPHDLADVVAAFYLTAWEVVTGSDASGQRAGMAAVRDQVRQMLAGLPAVARMSMAERQATAETLAFYTIVIAARHHELLAVGGPALAAFREELAQAVALQQGIDLRRLALTPAGFEAR